MQIINDSSTETTPGAAVKGSWFCGSRLYFSRQAERRFFFILTIAMAVWGLLARFGLLA